MPRNTNNEKVVCEACGNHFPADSPTCPTCKWLVENKPAIEDQFLRTMRRIARAVETIRYYMWNDRESEGKRR